MLSGALLALVSIWGTGLFPESGLAQEGFKWGRMEIHPGVAFEAQYNDNIFLEADKRFANGQQESPRDDFIFTTAPSLTIQQKRRKGDYFGFAFNYLGKDERFVELEDQDFFSHDISALLELGDVGGDLKWTLGGSFLNTRLPITLEFASNLNPRQERTTYDLDSNLQWRLSQDVETDIGFEYRRNLFNNIGTTGDVNLQEYERYGGSGTLSWQTTALTSIGVNYSYRFRDYAIDSAFNADSYKQSISLVMKWDPVSVLRTELWLGSNHLNFKGVEGQDRDDLIYKIKLFYQPKSSRLWSFDVFREISNSYFVDIQAFQKTVVRLNLDQKIGVKWNLESQISYQANNYDIAAIDVAGGGSLKFRSDDRFDFMLSLNYIIQEWLNMEMEYSYTINDSNFNNFDYSRNILFLRFSLMF